MQIRFSDHNKKGKIIFMMGPFILAPFPNYAVVVQTLISLHGCPEAPLSVAPQIWFLDHNENAKNHIFC